MGATKATADKSSRSAAVTPAKAQAPARPFFAAAIQPKMAVSQPGDKFEQEADRTADRIMRMPAPIAAGELQRQPAGALQRKEEDRIMRAETGGAGKAEGPVVEPDVQAAIGRKMAGGAPLAADVRGHMEPRFGADFGGVRVHQDGEAAALGNRLGARAFTVQNHIFFARGQYQPGTTDGQRLLAHELTHTVQQGAAIQRSPDISAGQATPAVQRWGVEDALGSFAEWAYAIPGFRLLTLVIGFNPVNMQPVDRSPANVLRGLIELMPGGALITRALDAHGVIDKATAWVGEKLAQLADLGGGLKAALDTFLNSLGWSDIVDLGGVWDRAQAIFTAPIARLADFAVTSAVELLKIIKDAILKPLAAMAKNTRGYDLLCVLLGEDPISGEPVAATPENLLGGFMKLIGQEEVWENIKKGNAIARTFAWFNTALSSLMALVRAVPQRIMDTIASLTVMDVLTVAGAFGRVVGTFAGIAGDFVAWGLGTVWELLKIVIDVVKPGLMGYIMRTGAALRDIVKNPAPFLGNLVGAAKLGFDNFAGHFGGHLKAGLIDWLTGSLEGVYIPKAVTLPELGKFAMSVLGITWAQVRGKIVEALGPNGERIMQGLELAFDVVKALVTGGIGAVWELIKEKLSDLKDQVIGGIVSFVTDTIVKKAIPKLIGMFIPGAGFIPAVISIYDTIMVFVQKISKIVQVVTGFIDSIVTIAAGNIGGAAKRVEGIMAGLLSLSISFLAGFLGLSKVTDKIMGVVQKVRAKVDAAIGAAAKWVVAKAKALFAKLFSKDKPDDRTDQQKENDKRSALSEAEALVPSPDQFDEDAVRRRMGPIKSRYRLTSLELVVESETADEEQFHFAASASPTTNGKSQKGRKGVRLQLVTLDPAFVAREKAAYGKKLRMTRAELKRQVEIQEAALNGLDVKTWRANWRAFHGTDGGREDEAGARADREAAIVAVKAESLSAWRKNNRGTPLAEGRAFIEELYAPRPGDKSYPFKYKTKKYNDVTYVNLAYGQAILHAADQVAGGGTETAGLGGVRENSSIGAQWDRGGRADALKRLLDAEIKRAGEGKPPAAVAKAKLKVKLPVVDG